MHCRFWVNVVYEFGSERSSRIKDVLLTDVGCRELWAGPRRPRGPQGARILTLTCLSANLLSNGAVIAQAADPSGTMSTEGEGKESPVWGALQIQCLSRSLRSSILANSIGKELWFQTIK